MPSQPISQLPDNASPSAVNASAPIITQAIVGGSPVFTNERATIRAIVQAGVNDGFNVTNGNVGIGTSGNPASRLEVDGVITVAAGTAAAPALCFSSDSNTGITQIGGADSWSVVTGGTERIRVEANGDIRVGSSTAIGRVELCSPASSKGTSAAPETSGIIAFPSYNHARDLCTIQSIAREGSFLAGQLAFTCANASGNSQTYFVADGQADTVSIRTAGVERLRVRADGGIGVGYAGTTNVAFGLQSPTTGAGEHIGLALVPAMSDTATVINNIWSKPTSNSTLNTIRGIRILPHGGTGTAQNSHGILIDPTFTVGTVTNYGLISTIPSTAPGAWNLWINGTAPNYFAGQLQSSLGTAAAPAFSFFGDSNTGAFSPSADTFSVATGGVERLRVDASGNVGIGVPSPASRLEVSATTSTVAYVLQTGATNSNACLVQFSGGNVGSTGAASAVFRVTSNSTLRALASFGDTVVVRPNGWVGVGFASPTSNLHVAAPAVNTFPTVTIQGQNAGSAANPLPNGALSFRNFQFDTAQANAREHFRIESLSRDQSTVFGGAVFSCSNGSGVTTEYFRIDPLLNGVISALPVVAPSGTSAAPALTFSGDSDTGVAQLGGADTWSVVTAGQERLRVNDTGKIGLGNSPASNVGLFHRYAVDSNTTSTRYGSLVQPTVGSQSTSSYLNHTSSPLFAANATTSTCVDYHASNPNLGAGAAITNCYGFFAAPLTAGTNNYAFYGSVAANGSSSWNFYAHGTAPSYFAGQVQIGAGSAEIPALAFASDLNTGIAQLGGADSWSVITGGSERLRVAATGAVGINATPTSRRLTVRGSGDSDGALLLQSSSTGAGTSNGFIIQCLGVSSTAYLWNFENSPIIFGANNAERMRLYADGTLDVTGSVWVPAGTAAAPGVSFRNDQNTGLFNPTADNVAVSTAGIERLRVTASGAVGIGTASPQSNSGYSQVTLDNTTGSVVHLHRNGSEIIRLQATAVGRVQTIGNVDLYLTTNNTDRVIVRGDGNVGIATSSPTAKLDIDSDVVRLRTAKTPSSATAAGNAGDICWDADYVYVCVAANTWKRAALSTW
jgi:hypothetical protein